MWNHVVTKKVLIKQIKIYMRFEILQSSHPFVLITALHTLGILSTSFMR